MAMQMKMQMKMSQQLIMTPQLQQAIKLLQLSRTELEELIEQTLIENPVLEEGIDMDTYPNKKDESTETVEIFDESLFPGWTEEVIQTYLDQGWSIEQLKEWYDEHS